MFPNYRPCNYAISVCGSSEPFQLLLGLYTCCSVIVAEKKKRGLVVTLAANERRACLCGSGGRGGGHFYSVCSCNHAALENLFLCGNVDVPSHPEELFGKKNPAKANLALCLQAPVRNASKVRLGLSLG